ncbi:MAG TPA: hypothetical protein VF622_18845 [Segetibacter sp.]|jgi:hypothetical protein
MKRLRIHFVYWILPTLITLKCILIYFFNFFGSSHIISPEVNREFGILENLQLLLIIIILLIAIRAVRLKENKPEKYLFSFIAALSLFFLFEEIDYGLHYYELFSDNIKNTTIRNIHNNGKITSVFKMTAYIILVVFFGIFPLISAKIKQRVPFLNYIGPSKNIVSATISLFVLNELAFYLYHQNFHSNRSLDGNVSEFEEFMTYYIVMLYIMELANTGKKFQVLSFNAASRHKVL